MKTLTKLVAMGLILAVTNAMASDAIWDNCDNDGCWVTETGTFVVVETPTTITVTVTPDKPEQEPSVPETLKGDRNSH